MKKIAINKPYCSAAGYVVSSRRKELGDYLIEKDCDEHEPIASWLKEDCVKVALLESIYMDETERGNGYGTQLLKDFIEAAEDAGADVVLLIADTGEHQEDGFDLVEWYERHDFRSISRTEFGPLMVNPSDMAEELAASFE
jgi:GNAT superfamily N-acetyltransferase